MSAWDDEYAPPNLIALGRQVRDAFGLTPVAIGAKGDEYHLYGYHRSRNWVMQDGDGTDDYSVQLSLDQGGDGSWVCALDVSLDDARMRTCTTRMITALRNKDPRVAAVREVYGTTDGVNVTGWDAAYSRTVTSDDSHLWHLHLSFYRSRANNDHSGVLAVLTGGDDMELSDVVPGTKTPGFNPNDRTFGQVTMDAANDRAVDYGERPIAFLPAGSPKRRLYELLPALEKLVAGPAVTVDAVAVAAALQPVIAKAVADEFAKRLES